jgi:hypothetical protein
VLYLVTPPVRVKKKGAKVQSTVLPHFSMGSFGCELLSASNIRAGFCLLVGLFMNDMSSLLVQ